MTQPDVSTLLQPGRNAIGVRFAGGWATERFGFRTNAAGVRRPARGRGPATHRLRRRAPDRSVSDGTWRTSTGPLRASGIYAGEVYDARAEIAGWSEPGFDDSGLATGRAGSRHRHTAGPGVAAGPPVRAPAGAGGDHLAVWSDAARLRQNFGRLRLDVAGPAGSEITSGTPRCWSTVSSAPGHFGPPRRPTVTSAGRRWRRGSRSSPSTASAR